MRPFKEGWKSCQYRHWQQRPRSSLHPRLWRPSSHTIWIYLPTPVSRQWLCLLQWYSNALGLCYHPPTPSLAPDAHLGPGAVSLLAPLSCWQLCLLQRFMDASRSRRLLHIDGRICCEDTWPPRIRSGPSRPGQSCQGLKRFPPRFTLPLLCTIQRFLTPQIGRRHALWPGACRENVGTNW